jgi:integrase
VYGRTQKDVRDKLQALRQQAAEGRAMGSGRQTVSQLLEAWLEDRVRQRNRYRTYETYASIARFHLIPALGNYPLSKLTAQHVQTFLHEKSKRSSASMAHKCRDVLRIALNQAIRWNLISQNVAAVVEPPRSERTEVLPLSRDQARTILDAFTDHRLRPLVLVALALGLRQGEILGLRWSDVNFDTAELTVRFQVQRQDGEWRFVVPKSKSSRRALPMPTFVVDTLRAHRANQEQERVAAGPAWQEFNLVFPTEVCTPQDRMNVTHRFQARLKKLGLPHMTFHQLRHGTATLLLAQGVDLKTISEILGHSQISTTADIYAHVAPELKRNVADRMQQTLAGD